MERNLVRSKRSGEINFLSEQRMDADASAAAVVIATAAGGSFSCESQPSLVRHRDGEHASCCFTVARFRLDPIRIDRL